MIYKNILETRKKAKQEQTALRVGKATINILQFILIFAGILSILILTGENMTDMKKETLKRHLKRFNACLHEQTREDGTKYTSFKLKAITGESKTLKPYYEVLSNAIYKQNTVTTNFDYEQAQQLIDHLIDADFKSLEELEERAPDLIHEWADADVSIYTKDLTEWLNENIENVYYLSEAINEHNANDGFNALTMAQYCAIRDIYNNVLDKITEELKTK